MEAATSHTIVVNTQGSTGDVHSGGDSGIEISIVNDGSVTNIVDSSGNPLTSREDDVIAVLGQLFESAEDTLQHMAEQIASKRAGQEESEELKPVAVSGSQQRPFACECGKTYTCKSHLKYHRKVHTNDRPYACEVCDQSFLQLGHLKRHLRIHTQDKPFACDMCDKTFRQSSHLTCHKRIHTDEKPYRCDICGVGFRQKSAVFRHVSRMHVTSRDYVCSICDRGYSGEADLRRHEKTHVNITYFAVLNLQTNTSKICGHIQEDETFVVTQEPLMTMQENKENNKVETPKVNAIVNVSVPVAQSKEPRPFSCNLCGKTYKNKGHLKFHAKVHLTDRPFKCPFCSKGFIQKGHLRRHVLVHTEEKPYVCTVCSKVFRQVSHLNDHMKIHDDVRPNVCYVCSKGFRQTSALKRHMIRMHATQRAYACDKCDKKYRLESDLKRHQLTSCSADKPKRKRRAPTSDPSGTADESGGQGDGAEDAEATGKKIRRIAKPRPCKYKCDVCNKPFRSRSEVKVHMRTHTNERPFECGICHKVFKLLPHLKDHMLIHTGERPFNCKVCKHTFRRDSALRRHVVRMHSKEKRHVCGVCSKAYASTVDMRRHRKSHLQDHADLLQSPAPTKAEKKQHKKQEKARKSPRKHPQEDGNKDERAVGEVHVLAEGNEQEEISAAGQALVQAGDLVELQDAVTKSAEDGSKQRAAVGDESLEEAQTATDVEEADQEHRTGLAKAGGKLVESGDAGGAVTQTEQGAPDNDTADSQN